MKIVKKALASLAITGMALTMAPFNAIADNGTPNGVTTARLFGSVPTELEQQLKQQMLAGQLQTRQF